MGNVDKLTVISVIMVLIIFTVIGLVRNKTREDCQAKVCPSGMSSVLIETENSAICTCQVLPK